MIEITVKDFMESYLLVPVFMEYPAKPPARFVVLRKADSGRVNYIDTAMFIADSYAETLLETAKLNEQVVNAFDSLTDLDVISCSERGGDYNFPDTQNKRYRYQAVQNITYY